MRRTLLLAAAAVVVSGLTPAFAGPRLSLDLLGGATRLDDGLSSYEWDTSTSAAFSARARLHLGPGAVGIRLNRSGSSQATGIPGVDTAADVNLTGAELIGQFTVTSLLGTELRAHAAVGNTHLGWSPDGQEIELPGSSTSVSVSYAPIDEWSYAVGASVERPVVGGLAAMGEIESQWFGLDVLDRQGADVLSSRETYQNWTFRLGVSWTVWSNG